MHIHGLIQDSATLANLCTRLAQQPFITVDTEFMRENTFYPELCLIQIAAPDGSTALVDPLAPDIDLAPFFALLKSETAQFSPLLAHALDGEHPNVFELPHQGYVHNPDPSNRIDLRRYKRFHHFPKDRTITFVPRG